jgi:medium-chain acyl-[acyl-carrier-protein] hydrolase
MIMTTPWIVGGRTSPSALCRLFCLPHSGSGAFQFASWKNFLPEVLDICPIQLPGRENRLSESPLTRIETIVEDLASALILYLDRPYILYGYSLGALIAFELARELRRRKIQPPLSLHALARRAPHLPHTDPRIHHLPDDLFLAEVARRYRGMPAIILQDLEFMKLLAPALRADFTALETYVYLEEDPLDCPIYVFGGNFDTTAKESDLEAWRSHTSTGFKLKMLDGDHFFIRNNRQSIFWSILDQIQTLAAINGKRFNRRIKNDPCFVKRPAKIAKKPTGSVCTDLRP